jgi:hypothetical protein
MAPFGHTFKSRNVFTSMPSESKNKTKQNEKKKKKLPKNQKTKNKTPGSVGIIQCLPTFHKTLGLISSTSKDKTKPVSHAKPPKPQL